MDENKNIQNTEIELTEQQLKDIEKLNQVLDDCLDGVNYLHFFLKAKELLSLSKDN